MNLLQIMFDEDLIVLFIVCVQCTQKVLYPSIVLKVHSLDRDVCVSFSDKEDILPLTGLPFCICLAKRKIVLYFAMVLSSCTLPAS